MATIGVVLVLIASLTWTATRHAVDASRFTDVSIDALRSPAGQTLIADELDRQVREGARQRGVELARNVSDVLVPQVVAATVTSPQFAPLLTPTIERAHRRFLDDPPRGVIIELEPLRDIVASAEPRVAALLPRSPFGQLAFAPDTAPLQNAARAVGAARTLPTAAGVTGGALIVLALAIGRRRRQAWWVGAALVVVAAACWALRIIGPRAAEALVSAPAERALAADVTAGLLGGWWNAALFALVPGLLLAVVGRRR